ncbi:MAG: hypothetical protein KAU62_06540 [Candidatus Heimdallarchaeota archaeon]|nr:hypothetical protein [Candidatus Heimdallarchaeota archaeon]MCG3255723.1 hypothetical protein [Candidatus Heimdallarchaeota archaeon]MCK4610797.1 hypothetical protein [Candidatus Heimdallarchaeota archaeon]
MGKLEDDVKNIKEQVEELQRLTNQISFNVVRIMGTLEKGVIPSADGDSEGIVGSVSVDLGPLEDKIEQLGQSISTKEDLIQIKDQIDNLVSDRIQKAEDMQERASNLLDKGMELVELEATLAEIKSLLEERILGDDAEDKGE